LGCLESLESLESLEIQVVGRRALESLETGIRVFLRNYVDHNTKHTLEQDNNNSMTFIVPPWADVDNDSLYAVGGRDETCTQR
jgi:hypothetical protein